MTVYDVQRSLVSRAYFGYMYLKVLQVPSPVLYHLLDYGYTFIFPRRLRDYLPGFNELKLGDGGWDRKKARSVKAVHHGEKQEVIISEYYLNPDSKKWERFRFRECAWSLHHEIGHAIDYLHCYKEKVPYSHLPRFVDVVRQDIESMNGSRKKMLRFNLRNLQAASNEVFAEIWAAFYNRRAKSEEIKILFEKFSEVSNFD